METVLQQPTGDAARPSDAQRTDRDQAPAPSIIQRLADRTARAVQERIRRRAAAAGDALIASLRPFTSAERALPIAVAAIVAVAALLAFLPGTPQGAVGAVQGTGTGVRLAVNGGLDRATPDPRTRDGSVADPGGTRSTEALGFVAQPGPSFQPVTLPQDVTTQPSAEQATPGSPVLDDGTLLTGYAPETAVEDGSDLIRSYTVQKGDTLQSVAKQFDVSTMTLWWANGLKKQALNAGQVLRIPPVSGLVYTVGTNDTLDSVAAAYKVDPARILALNGLDDPTLVVGQVLVLPGATGAPMPTPKPTPKPAPRTGLTANVLSGGPSSYAGGKFQWPVIGGNNYISQYFHYGHWAIDIAADYGSKVVAAAGGKVIFAGWKSNGGGYQVWLSHGSGLYTTYNHMSAVTVAAGQSVGRGQQVGRIGATGNATGPHLHFEVWVGPVWNGGTRVNPMGYF